MLTRDGLQYFLEPNRENVLIKKLLVILIGIVCFFGGKEAAKRIIDYIREPSKVSTSLLDETWKETTIGSKGLRISTPFGLQNLNADIPAEAKAKIETMKMLTADEKGIAISAGYTKYVEGMEVNLPSAVEGAVSNIKKMDGVVSVENKDAALTMAGMPAMEGTASILRSDGVLLRMHTLVFGGGRELWTVIMIHRGDQPLGNKIWSEIKGRITVVDDASSRGQVLN